MLIHPWLATLVAAIIAIMAVYYIDNLEERRYQSQLHSETLEQLSQLRGAIEARLNSDLQLFTGLVAYISLHPQITPMEMQSMIKALMEKRELVRSVGVAEQFVIRHVYPLAGNEKALGLNYLTNESQREPVLRAVNTRMNVLAGPVTLVQGGQALIGRLPVFTAVEHEHAPPGSFWGIVSIVIDMDKLFAQVGLNNPDLAIEVAVRGRDGLGQLGDTFFGNPALFDSASVLQDLSLPGGRWRMAGVANEKLRSHISGFRLTLRIMGALVVVLFSIAAYVVSRQLQQQRQIIEVQERTREQIWHAATHDPLTGMVNRHLFTEELQHYIAIAERNKHNLAVLFLDLDRFKDINDSFGHQVGDEFLKQFSDKLARQIRSTELVARLGGDEFAIVSEGAIDANTASYLAQRITDLLNKPFQVGLNTLHAGVSIGIAMYPQDGLTPNELLHNADLAMYRAKENPLSSYSFFEESMNQAVQAHKRQVEDIRCGLEKEQFSIVYQPVVDIIHSRVIAIEALARWNHPERGAISPAEFIPVAEKSGLIIPFGSWSIQQACSEYVTQIVTEKAPIELSINLSPIQLHRGDPLALVAQTLERYPIPPASLDIEITESAILEDVAKATEIVRALREAGISVTIDDFGTGYSSLSHLRYLPVNRIKIDLSFVRQIGQDAHSEAIIKAILFLSNSLNIRATAEGVETLQQLDFLQRHGCTEIQGYLFCRPLPARDLADYLNSFSMAGGLTEEMSIHP